LAPHCGILIAGAAIDRTATLEDSPMTLFIICVAAALLISATCSLLEATLLSLPSSYVGTMSGKHPAAARIWKRFKENIERPIAVILVMNTAAHTIGATIAGAQFEKLWGPESLIVFSLIFTFLMLQFTEILPKTLGVRFNRNLAPLIVRPLDVAVRVMAPVLWLVHLINRPFERGHRTDDTTLEEIAAMAATARLAELIDPRQARMISAASQVDDLLVRQIMTPRTEVMYLRLDQPVGEILDVLQNNPYTRLPVCEGDIDHVIGMAHIRDLFHHLNLVPGRLRIEDVIPERPIAAPPVPGAGLHVIGSGEIDLRAIRREVLFLPEHTRVLDALRRFQESQIHLAIVVNEYGSTAGIVTLEDVLEEVVGEIQDEFDPPKRALVKEEDGGYRIHGRYPTHELRVLLPELPDLEDVDTMGGYVAKSFGRIPETGESIEVGHYILRVLASDARRVTEVFVRRIPREGAAGKD